MTRGWGVVCGAVLALASCHQGAHKATTPDAPHHAGGGGGSSHGPDGGGEATSPGSTHKVTLAVLPAESRRFRKLAGALNQRLPSVRLRGVDDYFVSKATLEVVQISIECIEDGPECLTAAGKSISANRLLVARISGGKKKQPISVTVTLFDVDGGSELHSATSEWKTQKLAIKGVGDLVNQTLGPDLVAPTASAAATPPKKSRKRTR